MENGDRMFCHQCGGVWLRRSEDDLQCQHCNSDFTEIVRFCIKEHAGGIQANYDSTRSKSLQTPKNHPAMLPHHQPHHVEKEHSLRLTPLRIITHGRTTTKTTTTLMASGRVPGLPTAPTDRQMADSPFRARHLTEAEALVAVVALVVPRAQLDMGRMNSVTP